MNSEKKQTLLCELVEDNPKFIEAVNQTYPSECCFFDDSDYADEYKKYLIACFYKQYDGSDKRSDEEIAKEVRNNSYQQREKEGADVTVNEMLWTLCSRHGLETEYMLADSLNDIALDIEEKTGLFLDADVPM